MSPFPSRTPPRSPGTALKIYFHRRTDVTSLSRGSDACIDRQMSLAHPPLRTLSLQSAVNCFQLNCLPFSRHPFAAQRRLFAPLNAARFRDTPNFRRDVETSSVETRNARGKGGEEALPRSADGNDSIIDERGFRYRYRDAYKFGIDRFRATFLFFFICNFVRVNSLPLRSTYSRTVLGVRPNDSA